MRETFGAALVSTSLGRPGNLVILAAPFPGSYYGACVDQAPRIHRGAALPERGEAQPVQEHPDELFDVGDAWERCEGLQGEVAEEWEPEFLQEMRRNGEVEMVDCRVRNVMVPVTVMARVELPMRLLRRVYAWNRGRDEFSLEQALQRDLWDYYTLVDLARNSLQRRFTRDELACWVEIVQWLCDPNRQAAGWAELPLSELGPVQRRFARDPVGKRRFLDKALQLETSEIHTLVRHAALALETTGSVEKALRKLCRVIVPQDV